MSKTDRRDCENVTSNIHGPKNARKCAFLITGFLYACCSSCSIARVLCVTCNTAHTFRNQPCAHGIYVYVHMYILYYYILLYITYVQSISAVHTLSVVARRAQALLFYISVYVSAQNNICANRIQLWALAHYIYSTHKRHTSSRQPTKCVHAHIHAIRTFSATERAQHTFPYSIHT